jgi:radical SAM superfamily enzyme YgiQ (UPF0313 family)
MTKGITSFNSHFFSSTDTSGNVPRWDTKGIDQKYSLFTQALDGRVPVYFIHDSTVLYLPMALGMMYAHIHKAKTVDELREYRLLPVWDFSLAQIANLAVKCRPGVWLFSDYLWTVEGNLWLSRQVKQSSPNSVVVHGGPSAPIYEAASERFLQTHPEVDIIVRGEGEDTITDLLRNLALCADIKDWSPLYNVPGIIFRREHRVVRTGERARAELENLPSPYLDGSFDKYGAPVLAATIETNRGCPYGCTFCDWGSATLQKIRNFDLNRVKAEIDWVARHRIKILWVADANFGIIDRDIEIADHISRSRKECGYPHQVVVNYAKNATKRVAEIVRIFRNGDVTGQGIIAIQTTDEKTLDVIRRKNIKTERYDELMGIFRRENLALSTDLMVGLPGSTVESFKRDLQHYFDRQVAVKVYDSIVLPNSPMADPEYMKRYEIEVDALGIVISSSTFSKADKINMTGISKFYNLFVEYGLLRYVLYYLQWTHNIRAVDIVERLALATTKQELDLPNLRWLALYGWPKPLPPDGWDSFYNEVRLAISSTLPNADAALEAVMDVNKKVMPAHGRKLPEVVHMPFDFVAYFRDRSDLNGARRELSSYGPAALTVSDPQNLCTQLFGNTFLYGLHTIHWELDTELRSSGMIPKLNQAFEVAAPSLVGA